MFAFSWTLSLTSVCIIVGRQLRFLQIVPYSYYFCKDCDCRALDHRYELRGDIVDYVVYAFRDNQNFNNLVSMAVMVRKIKSFQFCPLKSAVFVKTIAYSFQWTLQVITILRISSSLFKLHCKFLLVFCWYAFTTIYMMLKEMETGAFYIELFWPGPMPIAWINSFKKVNICL